MLAAQTDVLVRGAGPIGCAAALALRACGMRVALLGAAPATAEFRPIALSYASRLILERIGAWSSLAATPIETIHVSQMSGFGHTRLDAADAGVPALGYVVEYAALSAAVHARVDVEQIQRVEADVASRCVVHAEGASSTEPAKRYGQHALVALVQFAEPVGPTALERFGPDGPLALLPLAGRYAVVWSTRPQEARALCDMDAPGFLDRLGAAAGRRPGKPIAVEGRSVYPLVLRTRAARIGYRAAYVGNAAQTLHPVAGQGLNLGLRDAWDLAQALRGAADPGDALVLSRYADSRRLDAAATVGVTDFLARSFVGPGRLPRALRGAALTLLDVLPGPRRFFARRMIYGPSALP